MPQSAFPIPVRYPRCKDLPQDLLEVLGFLGKLLEVPLNHVIQLLGCLFLLVLGKREFGGKCIKDSSRLILEFTVFLGIFNEILLGFGDSHAFDQFHDGILRLLGGSGASRLLGRCRLRGGRSDASRLLV